jgi:NtrC-family two-component system response regulator AlgB
MDFNLRSKPMSASSTLISTQRSCLVIDDEAQIRKTIGYTLEAEGWQVRQCADLDSAKAAMQEGFFELALVDLRLGSESGMDLIPLLKESQPGICIVMITAYVSISGAVEAMRRGAMDYLPKPFAPADIRRAAGQALALSGHLRRGSGLDSKTLLESKVPSVRRLLGQLRKVAESGSIALLLQGETGTGKGVFAKAVHDWSPRRDRPFVVVACPALSPELLESELFGHEKGAFTGAYREHKGRLAQAEGGTFFLDEIGDLSLPLQTKLLRVLQNKEYERLGSSETQKADVRIIAATHVDLAAAVKAGTFREDLYYRLSAVELLVPPLRERAEDLQDLAGLMLEELRQELGRGPLRLNSEVITAFKRYAWPGNLREMRNILERACVLGNSQAVELADLSPFFANKGMLTMGPEKGVEPGRMEALPSLDEVELEHIRKVLALSPTLERAARVLGMDAATLWRKRKKHKL